MVRLFVVVTFSISALAVAATKKPPRVYIDKGACPFECCIYREWTVTRDTDLYDSVHGKKKVGRAKKGSTVTGVTGEVHTIPMKMTGKDGSIFYVLTYHGEGVWSIWRNGVVENEYYQEWDDDRHPKSTWWVQIKLSDGTLGWTKESKNFANKDQCG